MKSVRADKARRFFEEDEDPREVFATFEAAEKGRTSQVPSSSTGPHPARWADRVRHAVASILRRTANSIDPPGMRVH
jgi:hypothetical protein